jgi:hypothetical protein
VRSHAVLRGQGTSLASTTGSRHDDDDVPTSGAVGGLQVKTLAFAREALGTAGLTATHKAPGGSMAIHGETTASTDSAARELTRRQQGTRQHRGRDKRGRWRSCWGDGVVVAGLMKTEARCRCTQRCSASCSALVPLDHRRPTTPTRQRRRSAQLLLSPLFPPPTSPLRRRNREKGETPIELWLARVARSRG